MENNKQEKKKNPVNIIAVMLAFVMGLCIGNIDTDRFNSSVSTGTTSSSLIKREQTEAKTTEKAKQTTKATAKTTSESETTVRTDSFSVYITPTGKKYHLSPGCAGDNKIESNLEEATAKGLTACKKCAGG